MLSPTRHSGRFAGKAQQIVEVEKTSHWALGRQRTLVTKAKASKGEAAYHVNIAPQTHIGCSLSN